jgi:signal transduction histidine kinase
VVKRVDPEIWAAVYGSLICLAVGLPVLIADLRGNDLTIVASGIWWSLFMVYLITQVTCTWLMDISARRTLLTALALQVFAGCALAVTAPRAGWTSILLIYTAGLSVYLVRWPATVAIIVVQTAAAAVAALGGDGGASAVVFVVVLYFLLQFASTAAVRAQRKVEDSNRRLSVLHAELGAAVVLLAEQSRADERLRISRELHDLIGHQLTVLTLELETASHKADPSEHVTRANEVARALLADVRATVGELRQQAPDLRSTLERIVADLRSPAVHLTVAADVQADETRTTALIRCLQEVVTNAIRHARATELWVTVRTGKGGGLVFEAYDNGPGVDRIVMGNGLTGIAERVRELGGNTLFAGRVTKGAGFGVTASVPAP